MGGSGVARFITQNQKCGLWKMRRRPSVPRETAAEERHRSEDSREIRNCVATRGIGEYPNAEKPTAKTRKNRMKIESAAACGRIVPLAGTPKFLQKNRRSCGHGEGLGKVWKYMGTTIISGNRISVAAYCASRAALRTANGGIIHGTRKIKSNLGLHYAPQTRGDDKAATRVVQGTKKKRVGTPETKKKGGMSGAACRGYAEFCWDRHEKREK
ncbi:hypothetical protein C8J57DRAFT_1236392 [Mycena rebaudengoi]|nr:hypothetical protein C8J57DRAFT_1236392 [Mycena rebaudengoi]